MATTERRIPILGGFLIKLQPDVELVERNPSLLIIEMPYFDIFRGK